MKRQFLFCLLFLVSGICWAEARDCVYPNGYPGIEAIWDGAIQYIEYDYKGNFLKQKNQRTIDPINNPEFQIKCSKFKVPPPPPYKCTLSEKAVLNPEPNIKEMAQQGQFGVCYATSALFLLEDTLNRFTNDHVKYSLSDSMCLGNKKRYQEGGASPVYIAVQHGYNEIVAMLLNKKGIDINKSNPLVMATQKGYEQITQQLLNMDGIEINNQNVNGATPLYLAVDGGYEKIVSLLMNKNADVNIAINNGVTPLISASFKGNEKIVRLLLQAQEINLDIRIQGKTAEGWATEQGHPEIANLISAKAREREKEKSATPTPTL